MKTVLKVAAGTAAGAVATFLLFANHFLYAWGLL